MIDDDPFGAELDTVLSPAKRSAEVGATLTGIRDPEAYAEGQWDLEGVFGPAFDGTNIRPTDIDGAVSRFSWFLFWEFKRSPCELGAGQERHFCELSRKKHTWIMVVSGPRNQPEHYRWIKSGKKSPWRKCTRDSLCDLIRRWVIQAEEAHGHFRDAVS